MPTPFQPIANGRPFLGCRRLLDSDPVPAFGVGFMQPFIKHGGVLARFGWHLETNPAPTRR